MSEARFEPERVIAALGAAGVRYVVVGGLAVGAHGVVRATRDLDLAAAATAENLSALVTALSDLGASHPIQGDLTVENIAAPMRITLETRYGEVHVLNRMPGTPPFDQLEANALIVELEAEAVLICSLAHLRQMKRAGGRPRDEVDLAELDELHGSA